MNNLVQSAVFIATGVCQDLDVSQVPQFMVTYFGRCVIITG